MLSTFSDWQGPAHAFLSFGFNTGKGMEYVSISVEARKEKGEDYSPFVGLFKQYELNYVVADENDVVKLRTNYRKDPVYLFPIETTSTLSTKNRYLSRQKKSLMLVAKVLENLWCCT